MSTAARRGDDDGVNVQVRRVRQFLLECLGQPSG